MAIKLKGKQIDDATITQQNLNITTDSIINPTDVTTMEYVQNYSMSAITSVTYAPDNLDMSALATVSGSNYNLACSTAILDNPLSEVRIFINGVEVNVGYGSSKYDCVFSPDGITLRTPGTEQIGDYLYWNTNNALYQLEIDDKIDFIYIIKK
jgi:hypothetical protein